MSTGKERTSSFRELENLKPLYFLPNEAFAEEVLIPAFRLSEKADCMIGFFSSEALSTLAPGLATYINYSKYSFRLIVSPFLRQNDLEAIEKGFRTPDEIVEDIFEPLIITDDLIQRHTLKCLSYLLKVGRIEMKFALIKNALFHPKVWLFENQHDVIAAHGSSNMTLAGIQRNFEQITVSKSWTDPTQRYIIEKFRYKFDRLWDDKEVECYIISIPQAVKDSILCSYPTNNPPSERDYRDLYYRATEKVGKAPSIAEDPASFISSEFSIPDWIVYESGPFKHQGQAVRAWTSSGFKGVLEMATGSGKTIAAMISTFKLYENHQPLLIVVAAPYIPLLDQWCGEIRQFGLNPVNMTTARNVADRTKLLKKLQRRLRTELSKVEAIVVSHDTLCSEEFSDVLSKFKCTRLLIADEVHNLGRSSFINATPNFYEWRLGLSATPIRQYDEEGTDALFDFFGPVVFRFTLEEAIGKCLVEYDYHVHPCLLSKSEMDQWYDLTGKIKKSSWRREDGKPDDYLAKLYRDRRELLETIESKVANLASLLDRLDLNNLRYTLMYASDKAPEQLEQINSLLRNRGVLFHQLTAEETANHDKTKNIIQSFQHGEIQVLTAKRVLDEGVNIPQICQAFILASTTVERQWTQRRGRLLRTCSAIGKNHSIIHDFIALPPDTKNGLDPDTRSLIRSELSRIHEFASLARNAGRADGPLKIIDELVNSAYL